MNIAILSGKGGVGKTFIATNLAVNLDDAVYIDYDIEEPNGHLFLKPKIEKTSKVFKDIPSIDMESCVGCKACVDFCKFNTLAYLNENLMVFEEMCHSCYGCKIICQHNAISMEKREVGSIYFGLGINDTKVCTGILNVGEAIGGPIISDLNQITKKFKISIMDSPPGSDCNVMDTVKNADYCIIVAEPTLFGFHNFKMVERLLGILGKPFSVIINKDMGEESDVENYCLDKNYRIISKIPYDPIIGKLNSEGFLISLNKEYRYIFKNIVNKLRLEVQI